MFGNYLASCSYDGKVIIWKELVNNKWSAVYEYSGHESSGEFNKAINKLTCDELMCVLSIYS